MRRMLWCSAVFGLLVALGECRAGIVIYTDRPTWSAAASPTGGENFNGFASDTTFQNTSVAINNGTVTGEPGTNGAITNLIDVAPQAFGAFYVIDGTTYLLGDLVSNQMITFDFTTPVTGWGADFRGVANGGRPTDLKVYDALNTLLGTINLSSDSTNQQLQFYGFTVTGGAAASRLVLVNTGGGNDVFGVDNIEFATAVPEPSTLASAGFAALLLAGFAWRRRRA